MALSSLLNEKELKNITIVELCKVAGINKSTFYLHYKDIYECGEDMFHQIVTPVVEIVNKNGVINSINNLPEIWEKIMDLVLNHTSMNFHVANSPSLAPFLHKAVDEIIEALTNDYMKTTLNPEEQKNAKAIITFFVNGFLGVIEQTEKQGLTIENINYLADKLQGGLNVNRLFKEDNKMWAEESVFYQIYPLGFCGAPFENDGVLTSRILKTGFLISKIWEPTQSTSLQSLSRTLMDTIQEITEN